MVIAKTNPVGLDALIAKMQEKLFNELTALWNLDVKVYPRCYVTVREVENEGVETIEHFYSKTDYDNLIFAEGNKCFFVQSGDAEVRDDVRYNTTIELYFTVNLSEAKPDITHRADEEVRNDVLGILRTIPQVTISRVITGISNVYSGFTYKSTDDLQPNHCFKIEMDVYYDPKQKNCITN